MARTTRGIRYDDNSSASQPQRGYERQADEFSRRLQREKQAYELIRFGVNSFLMDSATPTVKLIDMGVLLLADWANEVKYVAGVGWAKA